MCNVKHTILDLAWCINMFIRIVFISERFHLNPKNCFVFWSMYLIKDLKVLKSIKMAESNERILRSHG